MESNKMNVSLYEDYDRKNCLSEKSAFSDVSDNGLEAFLGLETDLVKEIKRKR